MIQRFLIKFKHNNSDKMQPAFKNESYSLISSDIKGASPKKLIPTTVSRPDFYSNSDIDKSHPKQLYPSLFSLYTLGQKRVDLRYTTDDITKKAKPKAAEVKPLVKPVPEQKEPKYKFIRDNMKTSDIPGATAKKPKAVI